MRLIINNKSDLDTSNALPIIQKIIDGGRISNKGKQYCYATTFTFEGKGYGIYSDIISTGDKFTIMNYPTK